MSFFGLALNNVRKNLKDYLLFILSQIVTTVIVYTFISLILNRNVQDAIENGLIFYVSLSIAGIILILFVVIFNGYMSALMNKKRKKEIGIYTLIGIKKFQMGNLLALETIILGAISLISGLLISAFFSKFIIDLFLKITQINLENSFSISWTGMILTSLLFLIVMVFNVISNYKIVYRHSLIALLKEEKKIQHLGKESGILGIVGLVLIVITYIQLLLPNSKINLFNYLGIKASTPLGSVFIATLLVLGTYLVIKMFLPFIIRKLSENKEIYYNNNNMIALSNLRFNLKSQINLMSLVSLLITGTLLAVAFSSTLYLSINKNSVNLIPASYQLTNSTQELDTKIIEAIPKGNLYFSKTVRTFWQDDSEYLSIGEYEQLLEKEGQPSSDIKLGEGETYAIISNEQTSKKELTQDFEQSSSRKQLGLNQIKEFSTLKPFNPKKNLFIVRDDVVKKLTNFNVNKYTMIDLKANTDSVSLAKQLISLANEDKNGSLVSIHLTSSTLVRYEAATSGGLFLFVSFFVSFVFVFATGSILYFKQSNEAYSQINQFNLMNKLGMDEAKIKIIISKQLRIIFFIPLFIGILHCVLMILANYLSSGTNIRHYWPLIIVILAYILIFYFYFVVTVNRYKKIAIIKPLER
ncbi:ABC transporter permease [Carnobacterium maltaromaticum]|uniref:ABC transporter permease n=1 Tax=Carnobacterium maltaromaticum TaxID=2751 RepID=UPI00298BA5CE|nr:ABC transporter permease [Carnobacterium maltaromaticum]MDW5523933.1 ABC transporter permease [Carnobacterium maltaromaticum]